MPASTPDPPYYAVIFTSVRAGGADDGYEEMSRRMVALAATQPGFLGVETAHGQEGITVSYWRDEAAIRAWRDQADHRLAQARADRWYDHFTVRVARVERAYEGPG